MSFSEIIKKDYESFPVKWWTKFAFHYTDISNALSVLQAGKLYSRLYAQEEHLMKNDNASYQVIDITASNAQSYVRFYFRPLTPTYIIMKDINILLYGMILIKMQMFQYRFFFCLIWKSF